MKSHASRREFFKKLALSGAAVTAGGAVHGSKLEASSMAVPHRRLGRTGARVSLLGLGLGSVFTRAFEGKPEETEKILRRAVDLGVNYWDTARAYGASEVMLGPVVEKLRDRIYLVSKSAERSYDGFKRELEISLRDLKTDHIDLYHIHNLKPSKDTDLDFIENGAVRAAREAREQGIIKNFGITGHSGVEILMEAIRRWDPDALLTVLPVDRPDNGAYEDQLLPLARERDMGIIAMKTVRWARNSDLPGTQLIRYSMSLKGVACAIVGLDSLAHLEENAAMTHNFEPMDTDMMGQMSDFVREELAAIAPAPWTRPGYDDCVSS